MRPLIFAAVLVASVAHARQPDKPFVPKPKTDANQKLDTSFTLKDLRIGKAICGPQLAAEDLKGKVVVVEFWGVNCPLCLAALPETAALHTDLNDFGLIVIGAHCQKATAERVKEVATARGAIFSITEETTIANDEIPELPHAVVFDHTGACVFRGSPRDAEVKARRAVGEMLVSNAGRERFAPQLAGAVAELKKGQSPHLVLKRVAARFDGPKDAVEDAKALLASLTSVGRERYERARKMADADPVGAFLLAEKLPTAFKGTTLGDDTTALVEKLKSNKAVIAELTRREK